MDFPDDEAPDIDQLLGQFDRELGSYAAMRDQLEPIVAPLLVELTSFLEDPEAEADRLPPIMILRSQYFHLLQELGPAIDEWTRIRGSAEQLWLTEPYMSDEQWKRFGQLQARETLESEATGRFDQIHKAVRPKLLMFGEMTSG